MSARTALITGGTSGIGKATAELLHERGFHVIVTGQNPDTIALAEKQLPQGVVVVKADARSLRDTDHLADLVKGRFDTVDVLFLNAGISPALRFEDVDEAAFDDLVSVNLKGPFFMLQKMLPLLNDEGSIIFNVGIGATRGIAGASASATAATKGALLALVPSLALTLAPRGIRVNAVSPGTIDTGIFAKRGLPPEAVDQMTTTLASTIPFGRLGSSAEIAEVVAFLASDAASYITGENIVVGGGLGIRA